MKVAASVYNNHSNQKKQALLPLVPADDSDESAEAITKTYTMDTDPTGGNGAKYKMECRVLTGTESLRTMINWKKQWSEVVAGLNLTAYAPAVQISRTLLQGRALTLFNTAIAQSMEYNYTQALAAAKATDEANGNNNAETALEARGHDRYKIFDEITECHDRMMEQLLPCKTLQRVKRYLRRECRKPHDMGVREYSQHLARINDQEMPLIPPEDPTASLSQDEMIDVLLFGTPKTWQHEMDRQGYDPVSSQWDAVVNFMERIELSEDKPDQNKKDQNKKASAKKDGSFKQVKGDKEKKSAFCLVHGQCGHSTDQCHKIQREAKRLKGDDSSPKGDSPKFGNKTWTRKSEESKSKTNKELHALVKKAIAKGVRKELQAASKKRKSDDSSDEEGEHNMLDFDLKDFNYEDMENLKIDDEVEV